MKPIATAILLACLMLAATPAPAATYNQIRMKELISVYRAAGLSVTETSSADVIRVGESYVMLASCRSDGRCAQIGMFRNYSDTRPTMAAINEWNNAKQIPEASMNTNGTLHMEMWISAIGATDTNIVDTFKWFEANAGDLNFWRRFIS